MNPQLRRRPRQAIHVGGIKNWEPNNEGRLPHARLRVTAPSQDCGFRMSPDQGAELGFESVSAALGIHGCYLMIAALHCGEREPHGRIVAIPDK